MHWAGTQLVQRRCINSPWVSEAVSPNHASDDWQCLAILHPLKVLGPLQVRDLDEEVLEFDVEVIAQCLNCSVESKQVNLLEAMTRR